MPAAWNPPQVWSLLYRVDQSLSLLDSLSPAVPKKHPYHLNLKVSRLSVVGLPFPGPIVVGFCLCFLVNLSYHEISTDKSAFKTNVQLNEE